MLKMIFDVPAEYGGALTILKLFYDRFKLDPENQYIFVVSKPELQETKNITVLRFPWIKKSWLHRLYFDHIIAPRLVRKHKPAEILSLQNMIIPHVDTYQTVYVHLSLPFIEKKFRLQENCLFWLYQNVMGRLIIRSIKRADKIIVQTQWMKDACICKAKILADKINVEPPVFQINIKKKFIGSKESLRTFFYPASGLFYKNHRIIVDAAKLLSRQGIYDYKILFTLNGNENANIQQLYKEVKDNKLPIEFIGPIPQTAVFDYYQCSVLIFPSNIETFGLPLLEARMHETPILAVDMPFSREILSGYAHAVFFKANDLAGLVDFMKKFLT